MVRPVSSVIGHISRADRVAARRAELLDVAWEVIAVEGERVSMDRIAAAAGITRPVLYRHFGDISGLYLAVAERFTDHLYAAFGALPDWGDGRRLLDATVDAYIGSIETYPQIYRYLTRRAGPEHLPPEAAVRHFTRLLGDQLTDYFTAAGIPEPNAAVRAHSLVGSIQMVGDWWLDTRVLTRREVVHHLTDVLWAGHSGHRPNRALD